MKKFTFILAFLFLAIIAKPVDKTDLQKRLFQIKEKKEQLIGHSPFLNNQLNSSRNGTLNGDRFLKSAMATLKLDSTVSQAFNADTQTWQKDWKGEYIYNSEMKNTVSLEKEMNPVTKTWTTWGRTEVSYGEGGKISSFLSYYLDEELKELVMESKSDVYYGKEGYLDSVVQSLPLPESIWTVETKFNYHYNESGKLETVDLWSIDSEEDVMVKSMSIDYTYNASGKVATSTSSINIEGNEFSTSKSVYTYNSSGKLIKDEELVINFFTLQLENSYITNYQYNSSGDISVEIYSKWESTTQTWMEKDKQEYTYSNVNFSDVAIPANINFLFGMVDMPDESFNKIPTVINEYEMKDGWKNTSKTFLYFSDGTSTNISEFEESGVSIYPNPASETVKLKWNNKYNDVSLEMYQITGAIVLEQPVYSGKEISISHLKNGVYLMKVLNGQQLIYTGKMVKK